MAVLESGHISTFIAAPGQAFLGGEQIKRFEREFAAYHGVPYAVAFNSATAALHAAVVAVGVQPGEEVIVPPYTFTSTATCALMHNAIPVFADIEEDTFGLDADAVRAAVSPLTRAMIPVHLFGHPADMDPLLSVARERGLKVIEDCAQAPGAFYKGRRVGTMGDCGIFSFTESKTIMTGEGGMLITKDPVIAEAARLVRNHGEMITEGQKERTYTSTLLGWNYRMTELEAALGIVQLGRLDTLNAHRIKLAAHLNQGLSSLPGLSPVIVKPECQHVYYMYPFRFHEATAGISRAQFVQAMAAEGIPVGAGYVKPLYLNPIYHDRRPAAFRYYQGKATYDKGLCPVAERMHETDLLLLGVVRAPATTGDMDDILSAMGKVLEARGSFQKAGK
ncbi:MAG: DegT/DnrJ/EryC1/StrS family aminotransferase [Elusimicrobia bacterium]|nr:DegT/DnrJ/EryC1/StrS family aminotransferase [Elusimicrobiota bacterium]